MINKSNLRWKNLFAFSCRLYLALFELKKVFFFWQKLLPAPVSFDWFVSASLRALKNSFEFWSWCHFWALEWRGQRGMVGTAICGFECEASSHHLFKPTKNDKCYLSNKYSPFYSCAIFFFIRSTKKIFLKSRLHFESKDLPVSTYSTLIPFHPCSFPFSLMTTQK